MNFKLPTVISLFFLFAIYNCQTDTQQSILEKSPISVQWHLKENGINAAEKQRQLAQFTIKNTGKKPLSNNWTIYFNQVNEPIIDSVSANGLVLSHVNGGFFKINPTEGYQEVPAGESIHLEYEGNNWSIKDMDAPSGLYMTFSNEDGKESAPVAIKSYSFVPFTEAKQINRNASDSFPIPDAAFRYQQNLSVQALATKDLIPIIPTPQKITPTGDSLKLTSSFMLCYQKAVTAERNYLLTQLEQIGLSIKDYENGNCQEQSIRLAITPTSILNNNKEAYRLTINKDKEEILIEGTDAAGVFYGIQSLLSLLPTSAYISPMKAISLPALRIEDAPRFAYRGLHLDVSRNFQSKASVKKILELMGHFKLNKFHFHLTDDEGWRLEIPDLPELTTIGGRRGHTLDEHTHLQPAYGSGPNVDNEAGSGYFSRAEYIEILKLAKDRHIEVIPEIDLPGHARAAIIAMEARYKKLMEAGNEEAAKEYLLIDKKDESSYRSVQGYTDNTTCVCQESLYVFIEKVVSELQAMHEEAGLPLLTVHTGGDEVPDGVWEESPLCNALLKENPDISPDKEGLTKYFLQRFHQILDERKLITGGWEEIAMHKELKGEYPVHAPNPSFVNSNFQAYVWNAVFGWGGEDMGYQLANKGYPVVLCNASNLYFDLAYDKDPAVGGLYWAGFIDTKKAFEFVPFNLFQTAQMDRFGAKLNPAELAKGKVQLTEKGKDNILGIQGQLWSETIINKKRLEESTFPKLLGLAERAWSAQPDWATTATPEETFTLLDKDWSQFSNRIGQFVMPRLNEIFGGTQFYIPPPGAIIKNGNLKANTAYPGLEIRYTVDGKEPSKQSALYTSPTVVDGNVRLKAFCGERSSHSITVLNSKN